MLDLLLLSDEPNYLIISIPILKKTVKKSELLRLIDYFNPFSEAHSRFVPRKTFRSVTSEVVRSVSQRLPAKNKIKVIAKNYLYRLSVPLVVWFDLESVNQPVARYAHAL